MAEKMYSAGGVNVAKQGDVTIVKFVKNGKSHKKTFKFTGIHSINYMSGYLSCLNDLDFEIKIVK